MKKRIVMIAIIVSVLLLSMAAGLLTARAGTAIYTTYLPLVMPPQRSKVGIAPGGYQAGDLDMKNG